MTPPSEGNTAVSLYMMANLTKYGAEGGLTDSTKWQHNQMIIKPAELSHLQHEKQQIYYM